MQWKEETELVKEIYNDMPQSLHHDAKDKKQFQKKNRIKKPLQPRLPYHHDPQN